MDAAKDPARPSPPPDAVTLRIAAPAERCYALVSDITQMGRLSSECTGGRWFGSIQGPAVGARFLGFNRRGWVRWFTVNQVVAATPGREFAFDTRGSATRWAYRFEPHGDGTLVTESRVPTGPRPVGARLFTALLLGGVEHHDEELRDGMRASLERLRTIAEGPEPA